MARPGVYVVAFLLCFALAACGERHGDATAPGPATTAAPAAATTAPGPNAHARKLPIPKRQVTFTTSDGVEVFGWFYKPRDTTAPAVVLVHQVGSDRNEWADLVSVLRGLGEVAILSIDLRGHGESTKQGTKTLAWRSFADADWRGVVDDVRAAVTWIQEGSGLQPSKVGVIGSSIGSSAALIAAADDATVSALVLLSPGLSYRGLDPREAASRFASRPLLMLASEGDRTSVEAVQALSRASGRSDQNIYPGRDHGVDMADDHPDFFQRIGTWIAAKVGITRRTP